METFNYFYEIWKGLPTDRLREISELAIRDMNMQEIIALRMIFSERYQKDLEESRKNSI